MSTSTASRADAVQAVGQAFKAANAALRRLKARQMPRPGELSHAQFGLLFSLCDGEPRSLRDMALAADVSAPTAAEMLDALADADLVERTRSTEDKRVVLTRLTERGRAVVDERRARYEPRFRAALSEFDEQELRSAAAVLERLGVMFDQLADEA
jgi:DNA-binding MarR family transcriptional regulator